VHRAPAVIASLKERLAKSPALAQELGAIVAFKVKDGPAFTLDATTTPPTVRDVADASAVTTITLSDDALAELAKSGAALSLYQHGSLRVDGSMKPVHRLGFFKQLL
jgi:hypothetical protein